MKSGPKAIPFPSRLTEMKEVIILLQHEAITQEEHDLLQHYIMTMGSLYTLSNGTVWASASSVGAQ